MAADADPLTVAEQAEAKIESETDDAVDLIAASMTARGAQGNLAFFAFTATPKPKTLELFGDLVTGADGEPVRVPFHLYSMRQAIEEGYILDVLANYTTYDTYYRLANTEPSEDPDVPTQQGVGGAGPVRVAAPDEPGAEGGDHRRALPAEDRRQDRRPGQGDGGDPVAAARGALQAGHRRLHRRRRATTAGRAGSPRWWRSPAPSSTRPTRPSATPSR